MGSTASTITVSVNLMFKMSEITWDLCAGKYQTLKRSNGNIDIVFAIHAFKWELVDEAFTTFKLYSSSDWLTIRDGNGSILMDTKNGNENALPPKIWRQGPGEHHRGREGT